MSTSDIALSVRDLSKAYTISHNQTKHVTLAEEMLHRIRHPFQRAETETFWAVKDVSFDVEKGKVVGIIGRNGAGKSTLLKVLSRITEPTKGRVDLYGQLGSLLEVGTGFHPELTGRENVYLNGQILGMRKAEIDRLFDDIVEFAGVAQFLDTPVKRYSSGMYVRLAFAVAAHLRSDILVLDEVLAVGDAKFQEKCLGKMKDVATEGRTVLFVSHNMAAVGDLCDTGILLDKGSIREQGDLRQVISAYLGDHMGNEARFDSGPLRSVTVNQMDDGIEILAEYVNGEPMPLPCLGFVVNDVMGIPIFGANPKYYGIDSVNSPRREGTVRVMVREPKLLDGTYRLSVWFGEGVGHDVGYRDCLTFTIAGLAGPRQGSAAQVGAVFPQCEWQFREPLRRAEALTAA